MNDARATERSSGLDHALLACLVVGLGFSALLYGEYTSGAGMVCSVGGGCDLVRQSEYSSVAGVSLPVVGVAYFVFLLGLALVPGARFALAPAALVGAVGALGLIGVQAFVIGAFCWLCLVVDGAAIGAGATAWITRSREEPAAGGTIAVAAALSATAVLALGVGLPLMAPAQPGVVDEAPPAVADAPSDTTGGSVRVFEFIDFECPACRFQHTVFEELRDEIDFDVEMVYFHAPLSQHANAEDAARAYLCAEQVGEDAAKRMADGLFTAAAPTAEVAEEIAGELGFDMDGYRACLTSASVEERLAQDRDRANAVGLRSLPTFWIGQRRFEGTVEADVVRQNLERARRGIPASD